MSSLNERLERAKTAALKEMHVDFREATPDEERIIDAFRMFAQELREPEPVSVNEWDERIKKAQQAAHNNSLAKCDVLTGEGIAAMISRMLYFLKDPEPADKEPERDFVRHPDGAFWGVFGDGKPFKGVRNAHGITPGIGTFRPMSPDEAFRPGAFVEKRYCVEQKYSGTIVSKLSRKGTVLVRCGPDYYSRRDMPIDELTLIKPAPEEK